MLCLRKSQTKGVAALTKYANPPSANQQTRGRVAERLNAPVLKTGVGATPPGVRIPPRPPVLTKKRSLQCSTFVWFFNSTLF